MSIATIRAAIRDGAESLTDLHAQSYVTDTINVPHFDVALERIVYDLVYEDGAATYTFRCSLYVNRTTDVQAQAVLDEYAEPTGSRSVKAAIETAAVASAASASYIAVKTAAGPSEVTIGNVQYLVLEFEVEVVA